jgi:hypothetical protein
MICGQGREVAFISINQLARAPLTSQASVRIFFLREHFRWPVR